MITQKGGYEMELRSEAIEKIKERLTLLFGAGEYNENTEFESLGMKSVNYTQLTTALEDHFDVEIPYMRFRKNKTIGEAADYIVQLIEG